MATKLNRSQQQHLQQRINSIIDKKIADFMAPQKALIQNDIIRDVRTNGIFDTVWSTYS